MLPQDLVKYKNESKKIIALTAWDSITGSLAEEAGADQGAGRQRPQGRQRRPVVVRRVLHQPCDLRVAPRAV